MDNRGPSREAQLLIEQAKGFELAVPTLENIEQFRKEVLESFKPTVDLMLDQYPADIENIKLNNIPCQQITSADWSEETGLCVQYGFGGGFVCGSPFEDLIITLPLAHFLKARVVVVDYRLAPEFPYPASINDFMAVYPKLLSLYGSDRLAVAGESAGGNLVLNLLVRARDAGLELPRCAALFSPWLDLTHQGDSQTANDGRDWTLSNDWVTKAAELLVGNTVLEDPGVSPLFADLNGLPPLIVSSGSRELLLSDSLKLATEVRKNGGVCDLRIWEDLWHVFEFFPQLPETEQSLHQTAEFIRRYSS
jgi:epsilon-lactone hydrolase